jgi:purine-nucleoside phosphorylase
MSETFTELERRCQNQPPEVAVVLGSGMGLIADRLDREVVVPFREVPGLPTATVHGHRGCLTLGTWAGRRVLLFEGRLHFYEGHPWDVVTRPMHLAADLGVRRAILTNAAGGIRDDLQPGCLMVLRDHLQWNRAFAYRFHEASPYSDRLRARFHQAATACGVPLLEGVYGAVTGPCYETPAEIRALRAAGVDAVGMSTAGEAVAGAGRGLEVAAVSLITNRGAGLMPAPLNHAEVLEMARGAAQALGALLEVVLATS